MEIINKNYKKNKKKQWIWHMWGLKKSLSLIAFASLKTLSWEKPVCLKRQLLRISIVNWKNYPHVNWSYSRQYWLGRPWPAWLWLLLGDIVGDIVPVTLCDIITLIGSPMPQLWQFPGDIVQVVLSDTFLHLRQPHCTSTLFKPSSAPMEKSRFHIISSRFYFGQTV